MSDLIRGHISEVSFVIKSLSDAQFLRWGIWEAIYFSLKHSEATCNRGHISNISLLRTRKSESTLVRLRRSDSSCGERKELQLPFCSGIFLRLLWTTFEYLWLPRTEGSQSGYRNSYWNAWPLPRQERAGIKYIWNFLG